MRRLSMLAGVDETSPTGDAPRKEVPVVP